MNYYPRSISPPGAASRKRKEMEAFYASKRQSTKPAHSAQAAADLASSNRLLAGYMAYEFLTKGTILGQSFDPARAESVPVTSSAASAHWKRMKVPTPRHQPPKPEAELRSKNDKPPPVKAECYDEVTNLLKTDGAHVPGVVNPTQVGCWIQM